LDKNVIFVYPLNAILSQLKKELEKDSTFEVLEVDMLTEYEPLVENLEYSITFSSDIKKTASFLEACRKFTKEKNHLNILISKQMPSGLVLSKMEKDGLNESLADFTQLKSLMVKINHFYKNYVAAIGQGLSYQPNPLDKIDTTSAQRIERLMSEDKTLGNSKNEEADSSEASGWNGLENENLKFKENKDTDFRESPGTLSPSLEASTDSKDRSGIPYEIKKKSIGASDWKGLERASGTQAPELSIDPKEDSSEKLSKKRNMDALIGESENGENKNDELLIDSDRKYLGKGLEEGDAEEDVDSLSYNLKKRAHGASDWKGLAPKDAVPTRPELNKSRVIRKGSLIQQEKMDLPEISFFQPLRVFDPLAFYMEILLNNGDAEFKKRYLKMCLLKVYGARLFVASADGAWEESTPESLLAYGTKDYTGPTWIDEGRDEFENHFVMPIIFDDKFTGAMGLVIPGQISHEKMKEMEFWCYLGRCTCN
jgi:hypothetical protein